jgi:hypothetical protein
MMIAISGEKATMWMMRGGEADLRDFRRATQANIKKYVRAVGRARWGAGKRMIE